MPEASVTRLARGLRAFAGVLGFLGTGSLCGEVPETRPQAREEALAEASRFR